MSAAPREELESRRLSLLNGIVGNATAGNSTSVIAETEQLKSIDILLSDYRALDDRAKAILDGYGDVNPVQTMSIQVSNDGIMPGRDHGVLIRTAFLERAQKHGLNLAPQRGAIYKVSANGTRVGLAVATERQPNRWFLGLTDGAFDAAVLLCQDRRGRTTEVCLPRTFFSRHSDQFSRSGGQIKFNVARRGGQLTLTIPNVGPIPVNDYVGALDLVAS